MTFPTSNPATYADIEGAPEHLIAEIINGRLVTRRFFPFAPAWRFTQVVRALAEPSFRSKNPEDPYVWMRPEIHIGTNVLVPEIAVYRHRQLRDFDDWRDFGEHPECVIEYVTDATDLDVHAERLSIYASAGIPSLWRIDDDTGRVETFRLDDRRWRPIQSYSKAERWRTAPLIHVEMCLAELWRWPRRTAA